MILYTMNSSIGCKHTPNANMKQQYIHEFC